MRIVKTGVIFIYVYNYLFALLVFLSDARLHWMTWITSTTMTSWCKYRFCVFLHLRRLYFQALAEMRSQCLLRFPDVIFLSFQDPAPLPYLRHDDPYMFNINLFVAVKGVCQFCNICLSLCIRCMLKRSVSFFSFVSHLSRWGHARARHYLQVQF